MKVVVFNEHNEVFSKVDNTQFSPDFKKAFIFNCLNIEHANIVVEKTREFTGSQNLRWRAYESPKESRKNSDQNSQSNG